MCPLHSARLPPKVALQLSPSTQPTLACSTHQQRLAALSYAHQCSYGLSGLTIVLGMTVDFPVNSSAVSRIWEHLATGATSGDESR